jgi:hypothetical protein
MTVGKIVTDPRKQWSRILPKLVVDNAIFQSENSETGVDDSCTTAACQAASTHPIIRQSDVSQASGGVKNN